MNFWKNSLMESILNERNYDYVNHIELLQENLQNLLNSGFRFEQGCILLRDYEYFGPEILNTDSKKTAFEEFINDVDINSYLNSVKDEFEYLKQGIEFAKRLYISLSRFKENKFRVSISFPYMPLKHDDIEDYGNCIVKFHTIRSDCSSIFMIEETISYPIIIIE